MDAKLNNGPNHDDIDVDNKESTSGSSYIPFVKKMLPPISPAKHHARTLTGRASRKQKYDAIHAKFELDYEFKKRLRHLPDPWAASDDKPDDVVAQIVFERTYQHHGENWASVIIRIVEGTYNIQLNHFRETGLYWNPKKAQNSAQEMAERMHCMKFLPPGRGLWAMGTPIITERKMAAALQNCAFISTEDMHLNPTEPFVFCMDVSMLGVGVGFDTAGAYADVRAQLYKPIGNPNVDNEFDINVIDDSRTGWVESLEILLESYFQPNRRYVQFDYSQIRPKGQVLKGFGGISSGPEPLMFLHEDIRNLCVSYVGKYVDSRFITDCMNMIARCVIAGNIRRSSELALGSVNDDTFLNLKNYKLNPERQLYGWTSNNSVLVNVGCNKYETIADGILTNGEPGLAWIDNMQKFGRMCDPQTNCDANIRGANPCMEMGLESHELCNLVETFPARHDNLVDFMRTTRFAFLYAKTVTLMPTHLTRTNNVMTKNRRIGTSMSGIAQFISKHGVHELINWCDRTYDMLKNFDKRISGQLGIPMSVKITTVKPSGTVSLLAGATQGVHFPVAQHYIRHIRISSDSHLIPKLRAANYHLAPLHICDDDYGNPILDPHTTVVAIPVSLAPPTEKMRTEETVSMWEQLEIAAIMQHWWADNQVSCTIKFDPKTEGPQIPRALELYQFRLKGISFLAKGELKDYKQIPYQPITYEEYVELKSVLKPLNGNNSNNSSSNNVKNNQQLSFENLISDGQPDNLSNDVPAVYDAHAVYDMQPENVALDGTDTDLMHSLLSGAMSDGLTFCDGDKCEISQFKANKQQIPKK